MNFGLAAIGPGGGQWTLVCQNNRLSELVVGLPKDASPVVWVSSQVLEQLLAEESDLTSARLHGAVTVEGGSEQQRQHVLGMLSRLTEQVSSSQKTLASHAKNFCYTRTVFLDRASRRSNES